MSAQERLFERLDPPAGGLERLRARLDRDRRRARRVASFGLALAAAFAVLLVVIVRRSPGADFVAAARGSHDASAIALGLGRASSAPVELADDTDGTTALLEVPTSNPDVAFYWVSSTAWPEHQGAGAEPAASQRR